LGSLDEDDVDINRSGEILEKMPVLEPKYLGYYESA
jgi:hypothetical protein